MDIFTRLGQEWLRQHERARIRRARSWRRFKRYVLPWLPVAFKCFLGWYVTYALLGMVGWRMPKDEGVCPAPLEVADAALSPDGNAHLLTRTPKTVCWWTVNEDGERWFVRRFHIEADTSVELSWDDIAGQLRLKSRAPHKGVDQRWLDPLEWGAAP